METPHSLFKSSAGVFGDLPFIFRFESNRNTALLRGASLRTLWGTLLPHYTHPIIPTPYTKRERKSFEKDRAVLWQKRQFGGQTGAAGRAAERSGGAGPIAGFYRKGIPNACSAAAERSGGQPGLPGLRPDHPAPGPAPPDLSRTCILASQRLFLHLAYIYLSPPFSQGRSTILFRAKALSLSHSIVETQKLEDLPFYPTKSKSLW